MQSLPVRADAATRREFVSSAACALVTAALGAACGGGDPSGVGEPTPSGVTFSGDVLTVPLAAVGALASANGSYLTNPLATGGVRDAGGRAADVIVLNVGNDTFRAFSSICTHERCTVGSFANGRITCPCHGSQYDASGRVLVGPATRALTEYATAFDAATRTVTVRKA